MALQQIVIAKETFIQSSFIDKSLTPGMAPRCLHWSYVAIQNEETNPFDKIQLSNEINIIRPAQL